jgi:hypothetical protein
MAYWRAFGASSLLVLGSAALALSGACSAGSENHNGAFGGDGGSNSQGTGLVGAGGDTGGVGGFNPANTGAGAGTGTGGGCGHEHYNAQPKPLDMYIMLDQSGSMGDSVPGGTKWSTVTDALSQFVHLPEAAGLGVGLGYFGVPAGGSCPSNCDSTHPCGSGCGPCFLHQCLGAGSGSDSCNAADYAVPSIEIDVLPGPNNMQADGISMSMGAHGPTTNTPTAPALQGAIDHAKAWQTAHPDHVVIAVLATDGDPSECSPQDIPSISNIANAGFTGSPSIITFVIGVGSSLGNLNSIAMGGGSGAAFIVDTTMNVTQQFIDALNQIRGAALGCTFPIPQPNGQNPDFGKVNVHYTPGSGGSGDYFPKVDGAAQCPASGDAWYYDDNANPTMIILCPATCQKVTADSNPQLDIELGCKTIVM